MADVIMKARMGLISLMAGRDEDRGASLVEYALLLALIAVVCLIALSFLGGATNSKYAGVGSSLG
jgi:pilus assembly protein Flp/PilA